MLFIHFANNYFNFHHMSFSVIFVYSMSFRVWAFEEIWLLTQNGLTSRKGKQGLFNNLWGSTYTSQQSTGKDNVPNLI